MIRLLFLMLSTLCFSSSALARPMVFVSNKAGNSWWISKPLARPMNTSVDGVPVADLNKYRSAYDTAPDAICFVEALEKDSIVGLDRKAQQAIDETLANLQGDPFYRTAVTADGKSLTTRAAVYETCDGTIGGAILVIGPDKKLEHAIFRDDEPLNFLWPVAAPALIGASQCFECDNASALYYDVKRRRFHWEHEAN